MSKERIKNLESKLVEAAIEIIDTDGIDKLSTRTIAAKANCSIGSIYNYFRDMNELILKINAGTLVKLHKCINKALIQPHTKKTLGKIMAKAYLGFAQENLPYWNLLFHYKIPKDQSMPKAYRDLIEINFKLLESALKQHLDAHHVHQASRILWIACHGIVLLAIEDKLDLASNESAESLCEALFENYLNGCK